MMCRFVVTCAALMVVGAPGAAFAHGDIQSTSPKDGARVRTAPSIVRISFTEAPAADGRFEVADGCGDEVLSEVAGEGPNAELVVDAGQPGRWKVSYRVISSADGHATRGSFGFRVTGSRDCSDPDPAVSITPTMGGDTPPIASDDAGTDFPTMPVLIGGGAVVALAIAIRVFSSR